MPSPSTTGPNPSGLCMCGCGQKTSIATYSRPKKGVVKGEPHRYLRAHHLRSSPVDFTVDQRGCWVWQLAIRADGYGVLNANGRQEYAHRIYYEQAKGPVPEGLQLDHLCRNRACVNPDHLEPVSAAENTRRAPRTKLTSGAVAAIRESGDPSKLLAERYGVSTAQINRVRAGTTWRTERVCAGLMGWGLDA